MPRMQFSTIVSRVKDITSISSGNKDNLIKDSIQSGLEEITAQDLPYLMENTFLSMVAPYTTGTVAITKGETSVTGTSTVFTAAMVGRKIFVGSGNTYYIIASFTSTTAITLDAPFIDTTVTTASINIVKDRYKLPADLDNFKVMKQIKNKQSIVDLEPTAFDMFEPSPTSEGNPNFSILQGTELDEYTTGTVSATANTSVITGSSTVWSTEEGIGRGTRITVGSNVFTIKSVDSDTQLTVYENISSTISSCGLLFIILLLETDPKFFHTIAF